MSNLTDFFPSTGGSSDITDPKLLPRVETQFLYMQTRWANASDSLAALFWQPFSAATMSEQFSMLQLSTTYNTYETILDVSSSTNGGYFHHVIGSYINGGQTQTETYKITVDGVATEIVRAPPSGTPASRAVIGWLASGAAATSVAATGWGVGGGSMGEQSYHQSVTANYSVAVGSTNITNGFISNINARYTVPNVPLAYPSLKFKETLKVEIKRSGQYTSSALYNSTGVRYTMI